MYTNEELEFLYKTEKCLCEASSQMTLALKNYQSANGESSHMQYAMNDVFACINYIKSQITAELGKRKGKQNG